VQRDAAGCSGVGTRGGCTPRHSVRLNLLTRFHRPHWQPRGRLSSSSSSSAPRVRPLLVLVSSSHRGFMITSARSVRPSIRPSNPSPWNLGWHLVNRERRRHSPFCTNFGLPAASERARRKHHLHHRGLGHRSLSRFPLGSREREIARASLLSARAPDRLWLLASLAA